METRTVQVQKIWEGDGNKKPTKFVGLDADYMTWDTKLFGLKEISEGDEAVVDVEPRDAYQGRAQYLIVKIASVKPARSTPQQQIPVQPPQSQAGVSNTLSTSDIGSLETIMSKSDEIMNHIIGKGDMYGKFSEGGQLEIFRNMLNAYVKMQVTLQIGRQRGIK